jgi:hypothetical protein
MTCAICLEQSKLDEVALVKGCDHSYCVNCILRWASQREDAWCPKCKQPFQYLYTYRALDGTLHDFPMEESLVLLKRATWFQAHLKDAEKGKAAAEVPEIEDPYAADWNDYSQYYDEYDDDDEVEQYYFSAAAGHLRVRLGNRPWGENGFVASGRMQARPANRSNKGGKGAKAASPANATRPSPNASGSKAGKGKGKAAGGSAAQDSTPAKGNNNAAASSSLSPTGNATSSSSAAAAAPATPGAAAWTPAKGRKNKGKGKASGNFASPAAGAAASPMSGSNASSSAKAALPASGLKFALNNSGSTANSLLGNAPAQAASSSAANAANRHSDTVGALMSSAALAVDIAQAPSTPVVAGSSGTAVCKSAPILIAGASSSRGNVIVPSNLSAPIPIAGASSSRGTVILPSNLGSRAFVPGASPKNTFGNFFSADSAREYFQLQDGAEVPGGSSSSYGGSGAQKHKRSQSSRTGSLSESPMGSSPGSDVGDVGRRARRAAKRAAADARAALV